MKVVSARHIPSGEMRLAGIFCVYVCVFVCVNALFFLLLFYFDPDCWTTFFPTVHKTQYICTFVCVCVYFHVHFCGVHACLLACYVFHLCSHMQVCTMHMYVALCRDSVEKSGNGRGRSAAQRGDLRIQPCSTPCQGLLPSRTQPEGANASPPPAPPQPSPIQVPASAPGPTQP